MGIFNFIFGKNKSNSSNNSGNIVKIEMRNDIPNKENSSVIKEVNPKLTNSIKSISMGASFNFNFKSLTVIKQYYNNRQVEIKFNNPINVRVNRSIENGSVSITFSDLSELRGRGVIQNNLDLNPRFDYNRNNEGDEFASAEINNSFSTMTSSKEYISLFQITKHQGNIISFLINNLPGDQDFYYLLILREETLTVKIEENDEKLSNIDKLAIESNTEANRGAKHNAQLIALKIFKEISISPKKIKEISKEEDVALALGRLMEGEFFSEDEEVIRAVGLSYYFISKAIKHGGTNPYLFVYRFSTAWEYNKAFYRLFANSEGKKLTFSPFNIMEQSTLMAYDHHLQGMQMADALQEPKVVSLDPALGNIFRQTYSKYSSTPNQQIIELGNKYHTQIYDYLQSKISNADLSF